MTKEIRYNEPTAGDRDEFGAQGNHTLHTNGVTVYFDEIHEKRPGYVFVKDDIQVAFIAETECDVSPVVAMGRAEQGPPAVRFADE